ncbi:MAG: hypothetical protein HZB38_00145 [Planctomycetes bacterium]|nr:hypothetical protein [Planctomycetota bacterium]
MIESALISQRASGTWLPSESGLSAADAEAFVHERYAEYHDAIKTREGGAAIQHIAACFVGFCDPDPKKRGVYYSLDLMKIMPVAIELGGFGKAIQEALVEVVKQHS